MDTRNDTVEPFDAPHSLNVAATGITPQEHKGRGTPNNVDFNVEIKFFGPICLKIISLLINTDIMPDTNIPSRMYGAMSTQRNHISLPKMYKLLKINSIFLVHNLINSFCYNLKTREMLNPK